MSEEKSVDAFRKDGKYLPPALRDFHDQKDIFKLIHRVTMVEKHEYCKEISWVAGQCYVIDIFLWTMARFGYTLQRSRSNVQFLDMDAAIKGMKSEESEAFGRMLSNSASTPPSKGAEA